MKYVVPTQSWDILPMVYLFHQSKMTLRMVQQPISKCIDTPITFESHLMNQIRSTFYSYLHARHLKKIKVLNISSVIALAFLPRC